MLEKRRHYKLALEHLKSGDHDRLPYAALELRMCLESIVYDKLRTYQARLPDTIKKKWKPDQALRALVALEPDAEESFSLRVSREKELGVPDGEWHHLGTHHTVKATWVRKYYNKLGSYVHETQPFTPPKYPFAVAREKTREGLLEIAEELRAPAHSTMDASFARTLTFECGVCGKPVICNEEGLGEGSKAICLDPDCSAEHIASRIDDGWTFQLPQDSFNCAKCGEVNWVESRLLALGLHVGCRECKTIHTLRWGFVPEKDREADVSG